MAYTTINKSSLNMNTLLYTGTGSGASNRQLTGVGFQPNWTWIKNRNSGQEHVLVDSVRGATKRLDSSTTGAEETNNTTVGSFISDGFQLGSGTVQNRVNGNGNGLVAWNWKAGTSFSNSAGANGASIASTGSINTTAGFSIIKYTGTGSNATVGHGLGAVPKIIIVKKLSGSDSWTIYHSSLGATKKINFDTGGAGTQSDRWNDTSPTNTLFSIGTNGGVNANNATYVAYCFADKQGYSKFGSYVGNGNADGTFFYTGFKPAWLMLKTTADNSSNWQMLDNKRQGFNPENETLNPNNADVEGTANTIDFVSNGFKIRTNNAEFNGNGLTYIYMAFGQSIVGSNNIPATAR